MIFEHDLNPVAISIFGLNIYWYSLSYLFGFIFFIFYSNYLIKEKFFNLEFKTIDNFLSYAILGIILGGRIGYVIFYNLEYYLVNPFEIIKIWKGGMSFHGGLFGLVVSIFLYSKNKILFIEISNLVACSAPIGIFLGRLANFINGELIGKPTFSYWGVLYKSDDFLRHPSQIYEAFFEGIIIFIILFILLKKNIHKKINLFSIFLIFYSFFRFFIENLREPDVQLGYLIFNLSMGQILCIPMMLIGVCLVRYGKS